ncbi:TetR/AcrR family transcriptional regulator [Caulobacter sp. S45]|uniref:TetR/AcrR family transcriptional regulator n=1 Tax=Caulobacter sp. S45 TaxID=1641861 RepID=UPI001575D953|nr:TetR/AcrR family transcriptional regulator [Caulobacter sp. S45]
MLQGAATPRRIGGKTVEERRSERWRRLVDAAVKVYGERGYRNSTVKVVCDVAGLTERYFYESFSNSEDLLCACFQEAVDRLLSRVRRAGLQSGGAPMERVRAGVLEYLAHLQVEPAAARVFLIEMSSVSARADALVSASLDRFAALLVDFLANGPGPHVDPPRLLLRGAIGGGLHVAQAWTTSGYAEPVGSVADTILQIYGLVAGHIAGGDPQALTRTAAPPRLRKRVAAPAE